jgi:truncated hemoglobin YjbI
MEQIDYEKLNGRIVEQAYENVLTKEQLQKLIQDKFDRAKIYQKAVLKSPTFSVN